MPDFRGDPASALLEVLDPRQNFAFADRYLDVPFDLSQVIFIATANYMGAVPEPLRDRMEVISLPGYTEREKLEIAKRYLVRRQLEENGLKPEQCQWQDEALRRVIDDYTHEAGVRELERQIGAVIRAVAAKCARGDCDEFTGDARICRPQHLVRRDTFTRQDSRPARRASSPGWHTRLRAVRSCTSKRLVTPAKAISP